MEEQADVADGRSGRSPRDGLMRLIGSASLLRFVTVKVWKTVKVKKQLGQ